MHINDLPAEILSEVFEFSADRWHLNTKGSHRYVRSFRPTRAPVNLVHVCQYWRGIALATPSLWTSLSGEQYKQSLPSIPAMEFWMQYSRDAPLHLRISWQCKGLVHDRHLDTSHSRKMLRTFATQIRRWESLSIKAQDELAVDLAEVLQDTREEPPLRELDLDLSGPISQSTIDTLVSLINFYRNLRHIFWTHYDGHIPLALPWNQFETVYIRTSLSIKESVVCLTNCTLATKVTLHGIYRDQLRPASTIDHPHTTLSNITSLTLGKSCDPLTFLHYFTLPSLVSLEIELQLRLFTELDNFLRRSRSPLRRLTVIDGDLSDNDIIRFFSISYLLSIPMVKLSIIKGEKRVLEILRNREDAKVLFPWLMIWKDGPLYDQVGWTDGIGRRRHYLFQDGNLIFSPTRTT